MSRVTVQFSEPRSKQAAAFVAMATALDQYDPQGVRRAAPARESSREELAERAIGLAKAVKVGPNGATPEEFELVRQFKTAIKRAQAGKSFSAADSRLADELARTGMSIASSSYTLAHSAR